VASGGSRVVRGGGFGTVAGAVRLVEETGAVTGPVPADRTTVWTPGRVVAAVPARLAAGRYTVMLLTRAGAAATAGAAVGARPPAPRR
jgi:hypothetical protein